MWRNIWREILKHLGKWQLAGNTDRKRNDGERQNFKAKVWQRGELFAAPAAIR
jgi:hypothetical protein